MVKPASVQLVGGSLKSRQKQEDIYAFWRSEEHTSELQSRQYLVCRLLLEKKNQQCAVGHRTDRLDDVVSTAVVALPLLLVDHVVVLVVDDASGDGYHGSLNHPLMHVDDDD